MNRILVPFLTLATALIFLANCADPEPTPPRKMGQRRPGGGYSGPPAHAVITDDGGEQPPQVESGAPPEHHTAHQDPEVSPSPKHDGPAPSVGNFEAGKPVPGKPGFVTSPYAPNQGYVDVRGYAPGTEVKDPYTPGKTFLVPAQ